MQLVNGVAVAAVVRVVHVRHAVRAGGHVGGDEHGVAFSARGLEDDEFGFSLHRGHVFKFEGDDLRQRRELRVQVVGEPGHLFLRPLDFDEHAVRGIVHRAGDFVVKGDAVDEGPEPYALYLSGDGEPLPQESHGGVIQPKTKERKGLLFLEVFDEASDPAPDQPYGAEGQLPAFGQDESLGIKGVRAFQRIVDVAGVSSRNVADKGFFPEWNPVGRQAEHSIGRGVEGDAVFGRGQHAQFERIAVDGAVPVQRTDRVHEVVGFAAGLRIRP